jgi:hypothetical protein
MQKAVAFVLIATAGFLGCLTAKAALAQEIGQPKLRDYNSHSPFHAPENRQQWLGRSAAVKLQVAVSTGLHPKFELPDVDPQIYGAVSRDGYSIQRIVFDSLPGFKVTGSLFLPDPMPSERIPAVLCPHGHWEEARFRIAPEAEVKRELASGAERFENAARHHIQARCVQLARMGCAVLHWDMIGYCDSDQISLDRSHRFASQAREDEVTGDGWLLYSPEAELRMQSVMALQSLATLRAVDAVLTLAFVDPNRIAITGASGGGTQSFIGAALDSRIAVAFPAVMVSTGMQGGCTCENASLLRLGTSNAEIAALIAPRPLGMTAANDWTRDMQQDGFPQIRTVYSVLGESRKVALFPAVHFGHNFNHVSRVNMYNWMSKWLHLGLSEPVLERDFEPALVDELTVWDSEHPKPSGGVDFERQLLLSWDKLVQQTFDAADQQQRLAWQREGWSVMLGATIPDDKSSIAMSGQPSLSIRDDFLGEWKLNAVQDVPEGQGGTKVVVRASSSEEAFLFPGLPEQPQPLVDNPRLAPAYTYAYNLPQFSLQARRLAATLSRSGVLQSPGTSVELSARGVDAAVALAAVLHLQLRGQDVSKIGLNLDLAEFDFADVDSIRDSTFLPGAIKYGGVAALKALVGN